jgi:Fe-S-cluster containining protein
MTITIAPPPARRRPPAKRAQAAPPVALATPSPPRAGPRRRPPPGLWQHWPEGSLEPHEPALLARSYEKGRDVPPERSKCGTCIALCCRYIAFEVDGPEVPRDFELLRWFLLHERTALFVEGRTWFLQVFVRCRALGTDYRCTIYASRPEICREYEAEGCDRDQAGAETGVDRIFRSVEELDAYRVTWTRRWEARRRKRRSEAALKAARTRRRRAKARGPGARATGKRRA